MIKDGSKNESALFILLIFHSKKNDMFGLSKMLHSAVENFCKRFGDQVKFILPGKLLFDAQSCFYSVVYYIVYDI